MAVAATDVIGFLAAVATLAAFTCTRMIALRVVAIVANLLFISYGAALDLKPILILHCLLLPLNVERLARCLVEKRAASKRGGAPASSVGVVEPSAPPSR